MRLRDVFGGVIRKMSGVLKRVGKPKKEEKLEIPAEWLIDSEETVQEEIALVEVVTPTPIIREPIYKFERPKRRIRIPGFFKLKRITAFMLLIASIIGSISIFRINPTGLMYYVPTTIILLDYLLKTHRRATGKWYLIDDIEEGV